MISTSIRGIWDAEFGLELSGFIFKGILLAVKN
jgi:hypothetical protein